MSSKDEVRALTKPDAFLQAAGSYVTWLKSHQMILLASGVGILVLGAGIVIAQGRSEKTHELASRAFADAQKTFDKAPVPGQTAEDTPADGFKTREEWRTAAEGKFASVINEHPGSGAARMSHLYLAQLAMDKGEAQKAVEEYRAFLSAVKSGDPMAPAGTLGLAAALEDTGKVDEALVEYKKLLPMGDGKAATFGDEALLATGRIYEQQGKAAEAREAYERVTKEFPQSTLRYKAQARLGALPKAESKAE